MGCNTEPIIYHSILIDMLFKKSKSHIAISYRKRFLIFKSSKYPICEVAMIDERQVLFDMHVIAKVLLLDAHRRWCLKSKGE